MTDSSFRETSEELGAVFRADLRIDLRDEIGWQSNLDGLHTHGMTLN
jgi:hypothetical protein